MKDCVRIDGEAARQLANCFGWPFKIPVFEFSNENGKLFGSYDAGLDYAKDGYTFEWEWKIDNPFIKI